MIVAHNPNRIIKSKAASAQQYQTVVTKYNMGGSSTGDMIYRCGPHEFETKSPNEFNNHINTTHNENETGSKAASTSTEEAPSIIEGIPHYTVNKVKVIHDFMASNGNHDGSVVYANTNSKAASVPGINKLQEILRFQMSNGRL